jgi:tetratricopeptide (TPR) repeat protein
LQALFAAKWIPRDEAPERADGLWLELLRIYLDRHDMVRAAAVAAVIVDPYTIVSMRIEKTFDAITTADPARFDIAAAYARALARAQARMAAHPELLGAVNDAANYFLEMDRPSEALGVLDEALARLRHAGTGKSPFSDIEDKLNWIYDTRARALLSLDRADEGIAQYVQASHLSEDGSTNVSQTINLADTYYSLGRPKEALSVLADFKGETSPYGKMAFEEARACAYAQLNDAANLANSVAYLKAHSADAPGVMIGIYICMGDLDGAAAALIAQLNDPDQVSATLWKLQTYAEPRLAVRKSEFERTVEARMDALRARADVQAAVAKVGRIEHLPVVES